MRGSILALFWLYFWGFLSVGKFFQRDNYKVYPYFCE